MSNEPVTTLQATDVLRNRPFTHPNHIPGDVNSLRYMVDQLCMFMEAPHLYQDRPRPIVVHQPRAEQWTYRLVIVRPEALRAKRTLTFVGFLGQRRDDADEELAHEFDRSLVAEIPDYPGLLSYSTMALISGNYSNLVLFTDPTAKQQWSRSRAHAQAVNRLAPDYYLSVRLYNGILPRGIHTSRELRVKRVKYYDYQDDPWWHAVRLFPEGENDGATTRA